MKNAALAGIMPAAFWRMTPRECVCAIEGYALRLRDTWDVTRTHATWVINAIRGALGLKDGFKPTDLMTFPEERTASTGVALAGDYDATMKAMRMREESAQFWGSPDGAPRARILDIPQDK